MVVSMPASARRRRAARRPVASTSSIVVRCGISDHDRPIASAVTRRIPRNGCRPASIHPSPPAVPGWAEPSNRRSSAGRATVMNAGCGPGARRPRHRRPGCARRGRSPPRRRGRRRDRGPASGRPARLSAGRPRRLQEAARPVERSPEACGGGSGSRRRRRRRRRLAPSSRTTSTWPTLTMSPAPKARETIWPATGEGSSTSALSVWTSTRGWSRLTVSPGATSHETISPSSRPSPTSGRAELDLRHYPPSPQTLRAAATTRAASGT